MTQQDYQMALSDAITVLVEKGYLDKSYLPTDVSRAAVTGCEAESC